MTNTEMIERVARAICGENCDMPKCSCQPSKSAQIVCANMSIRQARAAIHAMRTPTEAMLRAGGTDNCSDDYPPPEQAWPDMIDAILKEHP